MTSTWKVGRSRWLAIVAGCAVVLAVVYLVAVHTQVGQRLDEAAVLHHRYDRTTDSDARILTHSMAIFLGAVAVAIGLYVLPRWVQLTSAAVAVLGGVLGAGFLRKTVLTRPNLTFDSLYGQSYPSGHAAAAMGLALTMVIVSRSHPTVTRVAAMSLVGVINGLIVFIPMHRPSDVVGGDLFALGVLGAVALLLPVVLGRFDRRGPLRSAADDLPGRLTWPQIRVVLGVALGLAAAGIGGSALLARRSGLTLGQFGPGFPVAQSLVVFLGAVSVGVMSLIVRPTPEITS